MKKVSFFLFLLMVTGVALSQQQTGYKKYFKDKSLRVDFYLYGDDQHTYTTLAQLKEEPYWGGSQNSLVDSREYGNFRIVVEDTIDGTTIYSRGFSSLFNEWQTTAEAKERQRMFYHAFQVPFPQQKVVFKLEKRSWEGVFEPVFSTIIDPDNYFIVSEKPRLYDIVKLQEQGKPAHKVDVAILAEGYTRDEMDKFLADARRMTEYLFSVSPFDKHREQFNVYAIQSVSDESGTDMPGDHIYKNTVLNSSFYTFDSPRYLTTSDMKSVADIAALVPYDQVFVLVNTERYGGGGFYNCLNLTSVDHELSEKVFVHEFGHGFVGLADEYYTSSTAYNDFYNLDIEPWEPNITTLKAFDRKWKGDIEEGTLVPTPRKEKYSGTVGVFEGGGYISKGIYSPHIDCRMKSNRTEHFCPVCQKAIEKMIERITQ